MCYYMYMNNKLNTEIKDLINSLILYLDCVSRSEPDTTEEDYLKNKALNLLSELEKTNE